MAKKLIDHEQWKRLAKRTDAGYYELKTEDTGDVPVRLFLTPDLLLEAEDILYRQIVNATRFPGVKLVVITPDTHYGYGVPVGCVILTDARDGAVAMGPVGFDVGCGMMSAQSDVPAEAATPDRRLEFNRAVMERVEMGAGGTSRALGRVEKTEFDELVRGGAEHYVEKYGAPFDRSRAERHRIPVDDDWQIPWGGRGRPERGLDQLGSLGGGNHFIELCLDESQRVWVMLHSGSRGIGNAIGRHFIERARREMERQDIRLPDRDLAWLAEGTRAFDEYVEAVEWAQDYALSNRREMMRLILGAIAAHLPSFESDGEAINCHHNYVARETHFGESLFVTRKGAIRAGAGEMGIIPGSMGTKSYIVRGLGNPESFCSCAHGAGRRMSRAEAKRRFSRADLARQTEGVECRKDGDVIDEIPAAYKPIDEVMEDQSDLVEVVHTLKQVVCVKG